MKQYVEMAGPLHDNPTQRETIEWFNVWYDNADSDERIQKKLLFLGDCVLRNSRGSIASQLGVPIDYFGSSSAMNDILFADQIDYFFKHGNSKYDAMVIQQGHHGNIVQGKIIGDAELMQFEKNLNALIDFLKQHSDKIVMTTVLTSIVPSGEKKRIKKFLYRCGIKKEIGDERLNKVEYRKNDIIRRIAREQGLVLCDLEAEMAKTSFLHFDQIHYEASAYRTINGIIIKSIQETGLAL